MIQNKSDELIIKEFSFEERELFESLDPSQKAEALHKIRQGELTPYIFGRKYFFKNYFEINKGCLIPRPDTERVLEACLELTPDRAKSYKIAELCSGCGIIALSYLIERENASALLCEISSDAMSAAKTNASRLKCLERASFVLCDLMKTNPLWGEKYDIIVSNPPYLKSRELKEFPDLEKEPALALDGGDDGLDFYRRFLSAFSNNLADDGAFVFEIGYAQGDDICRLAENFGFSCTVKKDYGGNQRVAILKKEGDVT